CAKSRIAKVALGHRRASQTAGAWCRSNVRLRKGPADGKQRVLLRSAPLNRKVRPWRHNSNGAEVRPKNYAMLTARVPLRRNRDQRTTGIYRPNRQSAAAPAA